MDLLESVAREHVADLLREAQAERLAGCARSTEPPNGSVVAGPGVFAGLRRRLSRSAGIRECPQPLALDRRMS
jgi:hypothetical protein